MPYKDRQKRLAHNRAYSRGYYRLNKASVKPKLKANTLAVRQALREYVLAYKLAHPCKCGEGDPACLDFHHTGDDKEIDIASAIRQCWSIARLNNEIDKCEVLCANCHRKLHARQGVRARISKPKQRNLFDLYTPIAKRPTAPDS